MNRRMLIAIEEEFIPVFLENLGTLLAYLGLIPAYEKSGASR